MQNHFLESLFQPKSLAVIGASKTVNKIGHILVKNILESGYQGEKFFVNPKEKEILKNPVYNNLLEVKKVLQEESLDVAIISIPAQFVAQSLQDLAVLKTKFAIIISAGFKESGNLELENKILEIAKKNNIRLLGPNCLGLLNLNSKDSDKTLDTNPSSNFLAYNGSFAFRPKLAGNVSLISQSGALISSFLDKADRRGFGFNKVISLGNKSDLDEVDFVEYLNQDPQTEVIALYLEGFSRAEKFIQVVSQVQKPVVIIKAGRTPKTQLAISSHTGSIAGNEKIAELYLREVKVILPTSLEEFFSTLFLFSGYIKNFKQTLKLPLINSTKNDLELESKNLEQKLPEKPSDLKTIQTEISQKNMVILTNAGGGGVLTLDGLLNTQIICQELSLDLQKKLQKILPKAASSINPVDILGDSKNDRYEQSLEILSSDESILSICVLLTPQANTEISKTAQSIVDLAKKYPKKLILPVFIGGDKVHSAVEIFRKNGLPYFDTPDEALGALNNWYKFLFDNKNQEFLDPNLKVKPSLIQNSKPFKSSNNLEFEEIQRICEEFELPLVNSKFVNSQNYSEVFESFKKPVVIKVVSGNQLHRTDKNMVLVGAKTLVEVENFVKTFEKEKILMQEMIIGGLEVFVGIKKDLQFGYSLVMGSGGIYTEVWNDLVLAPIPITEATIVRFLRQSKLYKFLNGYRNKFYDLDFLVKNIYKITVLAQTYPQISSIDINPFIILPKDSKMGGKIVDFKVILESENDI